MVISEEPTKVTDGNDTTPDDFVEVDSFEIDVDGKKQEIKVDAEGNPLYEEPERFAGDPKGAKEYRRKITLELSKTLSKTKIERTNQNKQAEDLARRAGQQGLIWDEILGAYVKSEPVRKKVEPEPGVLSDDQYTRVYEDTYNKTMQKFLGVDSAEGLQEIRDDDPGRYEKAQIRANAAVSSSMAKMTAREVNTDLNAKLASSARIQEITSLVSASGDHNPSDVIQYARDMKIEHLPSQTIYMLFETQAKQKIDRTIEHNKIGRIKSATPRVLKATRTRTKKYADMTEAEIAGLSKDELDKALDEIGNE
jgi:hypothetical protein